VSNSPKYQEIAPVSHADAEAIFSSGDAELTARALIALGLHDRDWKWVQGQCLRLLSDPSEVVVSAAILALGHTARVNQALDRDTVVTAIGSLAADARYAGKVQDALDDIAMFTKARQKRGTMGADGRKNKLRKRASSQARSQTHKDGQPRKRTPSATG
jgi:hypothetical protein